MGSAGGPRPAKLQDVRDIIGDFDRIRETEYNRIHEAFANLYESCLPPLEAKYAKRPEDANSWWWSVYIANPNDKDSYRFDLSSSAPCWRVLAQEQVKLVRGSENQTREEERLLFLLVGEDVKQSDKKNILSKVPSSFRAAVPSPLIANTVERNFLVDAEGRR